MNTQLTLASLRQSNYLSGVCPSYQTEVIDRQLDDLLKHEKIESSQSPWSSPVVQAHKHDGTFHICVDDRKLNQCTMKVVQPLPRADDLLEAMGRVHWLSCLDLASGYWQLKERRSAED